jgi:hypothetical protein
MSFIQTPSLATATSTRLDSACKHIQQCRVSYDHMIDFVGSAHELERNKMQYCVHKDEMTVGVARPWAKDSTRILPPSAYPRIVSNLGDITLKSEYEPALKMIKYIYHFTTSLQKRKQIIDQMRATPHTPMPIANLPPGQHHYLSNDQGVPLNLPVHLPKMFDFYPVGFSNTMGYAHPNSGDTMSSIMIGGLRTVVNGDFEVFAGDMIQWYWTFELNCFDRDGVRKSICNAAHNVCEGGNPEVDYSNLANNQTTEDQIPQRDMQRKQYGDQMYGLHKDHKGPSDKNRHVARIKPYIRDDAQPACTTGTACSLWRSRRRDRTTR